MKIPVRNAITAVLIICAVAVITLLLRREFFFLDDVSVLDTSQVRQLDINAWQQVSQGGILVGSHNAKVKIVEFYDYECPFCQRVEPILDKIRQKYLTEVATVHRHFPLPFHATAYQSAIAAECAHAQGVFLEYHKVIFEHQHFSATLDWTNMARTVGMPDITRFQECVKTRLPSNKIDRDIKLADSLKINAIPTLIVDRKLFQGVLSFDELDNIVQRSFDVSE